MAAPGMATWIAGNADAHGIEMDVAHQLKHIGLFIHQDGFMTALKEMTLAAVLLVKPTGITKREVLNDLGKRGIGDFKGQMHVIAHPAMGVNAMPRAHDPLRPQCLEALAVFVLGE